MGTTTNTLTPSPDQTNANGVLMFKERVIDDEHIAITVIFNGAEKGTVKFVILGE